MADQPNGNTRNEEPVSPPPPGTQRADHDGELMNLEDLRREREGVPHVDLAQDIHRPPASRQEREAMREASEAAGDSPGAAAPGA